MAEDEDFKPEPLAPPSHKLPMYDLAPRGAGQPASPPEPVSAPSAPAGTPGEGLQTPGPSSPVAGVPVTTSSETEEEARRPAHVPCYWAFMGG